MYKEILNNIIEEILNREDLFKSKKTEFEKKLEYLGRSMMYRIFCGSYQNFINSFDENNYR